MIEFADIRVTSPGDPRPGEMLPYHARAYEATSSRTSKTDVIESGLTATFASRIEAEAFEGL